MRFTAFKADVDVSNHARLQEASSLPDLHIDKEAPATLSESLQENFAGMESQQGSSAGQNYTARRFRTEVNTTSATPHFQRLPPEAHLLNIIIPSEKPVQRFLGTRVLMEGVHVRSRGAIT
jgi:hypothetical protein